MQLARSSFLFFGLLFSVLSSSLSQKLPDAFSAVQGSNGSGYHRVLGDAEACPDRIRLEKKWQALGPKQVAVMKGELWALKFGATWKDGAKTQTNGTECGYLSLGILSPEWPKEVRDRVIIGKIYYGSAQSACLPIQAPHFSEATMVKRSLFNDSSVVAKLRDVNVGMLTGLFGEKSTKMLFYCNKRVQGSLKNCVYVDGEGNASSVIDGEEMLFKNGVRVTGRRSSMESIIKALRYSRVEKNETSDQLSAFSSPDNHPKERGGSNFQASGLDDDETYVMEMKGHSVPPNSLVSGSDDKASRKSAACFPKDATVELRNGSHINMDSISVSGIIKVGMNEYSEVFMFTHKTAEGQNAFIRVKTASGDEISLSEGHYIYANGILVPASRLRVGDELLLGNGKASPVASVHISVEAGLYNPQTVSGSIVVNGVVASTYTTAIEPSIAHAALAPLRGLHQTLGLSTGALDHGASGFLLVKALDVLQFLQTKARFQRYA